MADRAIEIQRRKEEQDQIQLKFGDLGAKVQQANLELASIKALSGGQLSSEDRVRVPEQLRAMDARLENFIDEAGSIREEARAAKMRSVERNAESLFGTLQSVRRKLSAVIPAAH